jgi:F0F1-type ATP synthase membrane subunit b/b'
MSRMRIFKACLPVAGLLILSACASQDSVTALDNRVSALENRVNAAETRASQLEAAANQCTTTCQDVEARAQRMFQQGMVK